MDKANLKKYKKSSQHNANSVQKGLMNIYSNQDGSLPDISHLDVRRKSRLKIYLWSFAGIAVLLSAIAWLGFLLLNPNASFSNGSIKLTVASQEKIASGDDIVYVIKYENIEKVALDDVEVIARYPDGFEFGSSTPAPNNAFNTSWTVGTLSRGQAGQIEVHGRMIGEVGALKILSVTASYRPENFSSSFKDSKNFTSQITSSILELTVDGPAQILPEKKVDYKISYKNNSTNQLKNIKILVTYDDNFVFQQAIPAPYSRPEDARKLNNQWLVETLDQNQEGEINITGGYLPGTDITQATMKVELGFYDQQTDSFQLQQDKTVTADLIQPKLDLKLIINGSATDQPISFDQLLTYSLVYKNLGQADLTDVTITARLIGPVVDFGSLDDKNNGHVSNNDLITWTKNEIPGLALIRPLDQGTINFTIRTKPSSSINPNKDNLQLTSIAQAGITKIGETELSGLTVDSNEIKNNINTDLQFNVSARYFDNDNIAVGTGPLPPVVGQTTSFRIYWSLINSLNAVNNISVTTVLPTGVSWQNKFLVSLGQISYSAKDNKVTWIIGKLPANKSNVDTTAWFDVAVTPTSQQEKKLLVLTDQSELSATDAVTNSAIYKTGKATTSNLEDDPIGTGRGLVIKLAE